MAWVDPQNDIATPGVDDQVWKVATVGSKDYRSPYKVTQLINTSPLTMEIDTDAAVSFIAEGTYRAVFPDLPLTKSS